MRSTLITGTTYFSVGVAVSLMLPQMEHMVRRIFAAVNECPDRILTAEVGT